ncbi:MAG: DUF1697 domain-containing protein [Planctomycetes bacterium]|nr:DUF1697 domain-containing protein [Planctomycetota bacterium]
MALLRGINVGGKNTLAMEELAEIFVAAGCSEVRTVIQSGNVLFRASSAVAARVAGEVTKEIERRLDLCVPVVLRTAGELELVGRSNPFLRARGAAPETLHVVFLAEDPAATALAALDPRRSSPDEFRALGREIYLACPNGIARSKLTNAWFDRVLATTSTMRNWRTVLKLAELAREQEL